LAAVAVRLHQSYDETGIAPPGGSKDKCLFTSLAVRDFLVQIGYRDATVRGCALMVYADDKLGQQIWSIGIGVRGQPEIEGKLNGHAVVTVPSLKLLIDTTVYQAQRKYWPDLPGMMALPYYEPHESGLFSAVNHEGDDRIIHMGWQDRPELPWRKSEDFRFRNSRRIACTKAMLEAFNGGLIDA
jgi:hypothetical protein